MQRLNAVQRFLETHEGHLPVRAVWLAWVSFVQLTGGDVLALARRATGCWNGCSTTACVPSRICRASCVSPASRPASASGRCGSG